MKDVLANSFGVLSDDISVTTSSSTEDPKRKCNDTSTSKKKGKEEGLKPSPVGMGEYKMPLVWIDLEMTGLDVETDRILEVACIITDGNLTKSVEGPNLVIHQSKDCMNRMGEWCQSHHGESGLTEKVLNSIFTERDAETQLIDFVKQHVGTYTPLLAGNSIYTDFAFLKKYMPELAALFSHTLVDVSSVKALSKRWFFKDYQEAPAKKKKHRALDDIKESIVELKYYKEHIFKKAEGSEA